MVFSSLVFLFVFLPGIIFLYYISKDNYKNYLILVASLFFYAWGEPIYIVIMLISIVVNFIFGKKVCKDNDKNNRNIWLFMSIMFNISMLGIFKYTGFFIENINRMFGNNITNPGIALPLGISFFTFQAMSYVIDVYRDDAKVQKNLLHLALYISLFPQLVAGPIVRYQTVADQIENRKHTVQKFENGVSRFIIGLSKKVLLSNSLGMLADSVFNTQISELTVLSAWLGIIAYSLQIFFDFSGYSDMAIGLGNMFGFEFLENFNYPYISKSASEFWRRWHISLGSWFKDYIYIPLGGSKKGKLRNYINLFIVWFLTGFWHGASWTFIAWGLYFGILIAIEKAFLGKILDKIYPPISHLYLVLVVMIGWIFFRSNSFNYAFNYIKLLFGLDNNLLYNNLTIMYLNDYGYILILSVIFSIPIIPILKNKLHEFKETHAYYIIKSIVFMSMFGATVIELVNSTYNPFLYFRF
ncbi:alginate O-acetylation protein [[Clostridium] sordellii]|uniref:Membrane-bound 0-ACYL transferase,MBOAT family n=1 Tax=Paraclostridium sordellii TaxID=1505 RepID=A0ABP1XV85_PARSO|nr:MBOAT family protein [Paeniclostridium sordellii]CEJ73507.1 putative membrane-bound 0-ACYL transferase,MBOAT family [[Clostridium] sordellii] [Paeniclostridium sordellii]CEN69058.1 alginate O-acetylation protein [[Clostridium] sordellii] [Paeniclostridium sordellii]CEN72325.1 alginate O-acetylation protein [[Clostridium] sordellii] [Paeniclostridium sordellii]CEO23653.1 alginate O-acetylation protein [[Clostridium] sordellii] [Paeniclostridium sordellii]CEP76082.1 alginate O-acetylation pro